MKLLEHHREGREKMRKKRALSGRISKDMLITVPTTASLINFVILILREKKKSICKFFVGFSYIIYRNKITVKQ